MLCEYRTRVSRPGPGDAKRNGRRIREKKIGQLKCTLYMAIPSYSLNKANSNSETCFKIHKKYFFMNFSECAK